MSHVKSMLETYPKDLDGIDRQKLTDCIAACFECAQTCTACGDACLSRKGSLAIHLFMDNDL